MNFVKTDKILAGHSRPVFAPFGESIDVNYNSNIDAALPVTQDLYTTLLLDFSSLLVKADNFVTLYNKKSGGFDFSLTVFDSLDILKDSGNSSKVIQTLEALLNVLKPANSRMFIKYI